MPFLNRKHARQGFEALAGVTSFFSSLAATDYATAGSKSAELVALLIAGAVLLSMLAAVAARRALIGLRAIVVGPFLASTVFAVAALFTESSGSTLASRVTSASLFGLVAAVLFAILFALRKE